jgi:6-phosphogluconolactonase
MTSRLCSTLITTAVLISAMGCSSGGGSGSSGGGNPTPNPVPTISSISPTNANAGGADFTITVNGGSFVSTSTVNWNGNSRTTTEVSDAQLTASITAADIAAAGRAQVTVVNPSPGGGTSNSLNFTINGAGGSAVPGFIYVANSIGVGKTMGNISVFSVDPDTGSLTPVAGSPFQGGPQPAAVAVDPSSKFLYEASNIDNLTPAPVISAFTIDPSNGALTPVAGSPFTGGLMPVSLAVDSTGKFLYTADSGGDGNNNSISEFSIDASTGALTPISLAPCLETSNQGGTASAVAADPIAGFLFAAEVLGTVCSYSIDAEGMLQQVAGSPFSLGTNPVTEPRAIAVDPLGKFVYTANGLSNNISALSITPGVGTLTPVPGSPFTPGPSANPFALAMDPLGRFLYVDNIDVNIFGYRIDPSTGALSMLSGPPVIVPIALTPPVVDPSGKFLYFVSQNPSGQGMALSGFAIDAATGALTTIAGSPFPLPSGGGTPVVLTVTRKVE